MIDNRSFIFIISCLALAIMTTLLGLYITEQDKHIYEPGGMVTSTGPAHAEVEVKP